MWFIDKKCHNHVILHNTKVYAVSVILIILQILVEIVYILCMLDDE